MHSFLRLFVHKLKKLVLYNTGFDELKKIGGNDEVSIMQNKYVEIFFVQLHVLILKYYCLHLCYYKNLCSTSFHSMPFLPRRSPGLLFYLIEVSDWHEILSEFVKVRIEELKLSNRSKLDANVLFITNN